MEFTRKAWGRMVIRFKASDPVDEVLAFVRAKKVPGELRILIPGNGGVTSVEFRSAEVPATVEDDSE